MKRIGIKTVFFMLIFFLSPAYCRADTTPLELSRKKGLSLARARELLEVFQQARKEYCEKYGGTFAFIFTYQQQALLKSSRDTGNTKGLWYYNFELEQRLWKGSSLTVDFEVDKGRGIDKLLPTYSLFSSNTGETLPLYVPRIYLDQYVFGEKLYLAAGKLDLSDWFDVNEVANSADTQFSSDALVNNPVIYFPGKAIGGMVTFTPTEWFYLQGGASTAESSLTKTGLSNAFSSTFSIYEMGFLPKLFQRQGNYRFIFRFTRQKQEFIDQEGEKRNDFGFALSFDQEITKRIGFFLRYGFSDAKLNDIAQFWSAGLQLLEPIKGRKKDVLGLAVAQSIASADFRRVNEPGIASRETMSEVYYSIALSNFLTLSPNLQVVVNPDLDETQETAIAVGGRLVLLF